MKKIFLAILFFFGILHSQASAVEKYKFIEMLPTLPQPWYFDEISDIVNDSDGNVYVLDGDAYQGDQRLTKLNPKGEIIWLKNLDTQKDNVEFSNITFDKEGDLYIAGFQRYYPDEHILQQFSSDGVSKKLWTYKDEWKTWRVWSSGLAINSNGDRYMASRDTIEKYDKEGKLIKKWEATCRYDNGRMGPTSVYDMAVDSIGNLYVVIRKSKFRLMGFRIHSSIFSKSGPFQKQYFGFPYYELIKMSSEGEDIARWEFELNKYSTTLKIAIDKSDNIYISETGNQRIIKLDLNGNLLTELVIPENLDSGQEYPAAIAIDKEGTIYASGQTYIKQLTSDGKQIAEWGSNGTADGRFCFPRGIASDSEGNIYIADEGNHRIQKYSADGKFILKWGKRGKEEGMFENPRDLAVAPNGHIYIVDSGNSRIQEFTLDGKFISSWNSDIDGSIKMENPVSIAINSIGNIYVAFNHYQICILDKNRKFQGVVGSTGKEDDQYVFIEDIAINSSDEIYVVDSNGGTLQKFNKKGDLIKTWNRPNNWMDDFFYYPEGIAIDVSGNVYIADGSRNRIFKLSNKGKLICSWGSSGSGEGQFNRPEALVVGINGRVYVSDTYNNRIQVFRPKKKH
jgi:tripartite motif-containing protein 71